MLGTRLRSWMEAHIVRSKKKQHRSKTNTHQEQQEIQPPHHPTTSKQAHHNGTSLLDCSHADQVRRDVREACISGTAEERGAAVRCEGPQVEGHNLSSPESAYSTGYSTDGTSPGASVPPEYYINLRTGKHYVHERGEEQESTTGQSNATRGAAPEAATPRRRRHEPSHHHHHHQLLAKRKEQAPLPESSTEEDIAGAANHLPPHHKYHKAATPKSQRKVTPVQVPTVFVQHRRTESYDESRRGLLVPQLTYERDKTPQGDSEEGCSSQYTSSSSHAGSSTHQSQPQPQPPPSHHQLSPFLSGASPRQRNRIRTNPWVASSPLVSSHHNHQQPEMGGAFADTSSTVGSSSTLSSSGARDPRPGGPHGQQQQQTPAPFSPRPPNRKVEDVKNLNVFKTTQFTPSPGSPGGRKSVSAVTTCSPLPHRPCRHHSGGPPPPGPARTTRPSHNQASSSLSSSSSTSSSATSTAESRSGGGASSGGVAGGGVPSDLSDDEDATLNEMLGKYDESYVYEKETDILSDSDPTDCEEDEDQHDYNDNTHSRMREDNRTGSDLDFIDMGSLVEIVNSDSECSGKLVNRGHCTYHRDSPVYTPSPEQMPQRRSRTRKSRRQRRCCALQDHQEASATPGPQPVARKRSSKEYPQNLNRMLMERLLVQERSGTRSAGGTPISARKTPDYNGKYLRNPHLSKLINSNSSLAERSLPESPLRRRLPPPPPPPLPPESKRRSNSLGGEHPPELPPRNRPPTSTDDDLKYRRLIREAETILEDYRPRISAYETEMNSQLDMLQAKINNNPPKIDTNEDGILKTISKTLEKIIIRSSSTESRKSRRNSNEDFFARPRGRRLSVDRNDNITSAEGERFQPIGRGFDVVRGATSMTGAGLHYGGARASPSLVSFRSFDLGNQIAVNSRYCPQSEPVKRKVYAGSSTFGKLQKSLMRKAPSEKGYSCHRHQQMLENMTTQNLRDENQSLKDRFDQLRRERLEVEARVRQTQQQLDRLQSYDRC